MDLNKTFAVFANRTARITGSPWAFGLCLAAVILWGITGPVFKFSETWQLVINTGTTIVTFLMVFLIQNTQNRDGAAIQAKLDELIISSSAKNDFVGIETLTDHELDALRLRCLQSAAASRRLSKRAAEELKARLGEAQAATRRPKPKARRPASRRRTRAATAKA